MDYTQKLHQLLKYSNPSLVQQTADAYFDRPTPLFLSTRIKKKYMIQTPDGKWVHFGEMGYEDYTKHQDEERRNRFRRRNAKWGDTEPYSPASLSYYLLW